jgi:hypothetical protein
MHDPDTDYWKTDHDLFAALPGGAKVIEWFGFVPSFHDASLGNLEIAMGVVIVRLKAFRMTNEVDAKGYFVLDRHALVDFHFSEVSGIYLVGDAQSSIASLRVRRITSDLTGWETCGGPRAGDIQVSFDTNVGLYGSIFARSLTLSLTPA